MRATITIDTPNAHPERIRHLIALIEATIGIEEDEAQGIKGCTIEATDSDTGERIR